MKKLKAYMLPIAIVLGFLFHNVAAMNVPLIPYIIFTILLLNFTAVNIRELKLGKLDVVIMAFQTFASLSAYLLVKWLSGSEVLAQGAMIVILCPVAAAVVVVSSELGADRRLTTGYTIYGNLLVTVIAPIYFSFIGTNQDMPFFESAWLIFKRISSVIALPFVVAFALQLFAPKLNDALSKFKQWSFPLWAFVLFVSLGQTIHYVFLFHEGNELSIVKLGIIAAVVCTLQFAIGKRVGEHYGDRIAGGQLMGQKNGAIGIWMVAVYLQPLASVALACYAISQNIFNSYQLWRHQKRQK